MNQEKISIIVPAYNIENYIENTLKSICAQTYQNLEIIVVDDGSKDGTSEILDKFAEGDSRIKVIHKENGGVTSARFAGMKAATGEWIGFVDGDDYIEPEMYEILLRNAKQFDADISHCGYQMVFPSRVDRYYGTDKLVIQDNLTGVKDLLEGAFVEPGLCNKLFHMSLIDKLIYKNVMDFSIKINEDLLMNFYLFREAKKSVFIDKCFYHYMVRKGSAATSKINTNKIVDPLKVLKIIKKNLNEESEIVGIVDSRILAQLVRMATLENSGQKKVVRSYRKSAQKELRQNLSQILKGAYSAKQKIMVIWVVLCPISYQWVHKLYSKLSGMDKKYEVN